MHCYSEPGLRDAHYFLNYHERRPRSAPSATNVAPRRSAYAIKVYGSSCGDVAGRNVPRERRTLMCKSTMQTLRAFWSRKYFMGIRIKYQKLDRLSASQRRGPR